jgi:hypothetical protein
VSHVSYVIGVEWGADRTLIADNGGPADRLGNPKKFHSRRAAELEISSLHLSGAAPGRNLVVLPLGKYGKKRRELFDWLDRKERA